MGPQPIASRDRKLERYFGASGATISLSIR